VSGWSRAAGLRAAALTVALGFHLVAALPLPHVVTAADLKNPVSREEVAAWARRLRALGVELTADELGEHVMAVTGVIGGAHRALLTPARPWFRLTGTGQGWALFANPDTHPARLQLRVFRTGSPEPELLYQALDPEHAWRSDTLRYRRLRGVYDAGGFGKKPRGPYVRFAKWIAAEALAERPDVERVEVRTLRTHTTLPGEPADDAVEVRHVVTVERP
jgi:hypothetical protein